MEIHGVPWNQGRDLWYNPTWFLRMECLLFKMAIIIELSLPADQFELGRILAIEEEGTITLESMVSLGKRAVPFFRLFDGATDVFEDAVGQSPAVNDIEVINVGDDETLYALDWEISDDSFFDGILGLDGHILEATGTSKTWMFEIRFPTHEALSDFQRHYSTNNINIDIEAIYNPTKPDAGPWFGLSAEQRETLSRAVQEGFYSIPRQASTVDLAESFDISDQAVTERLRRAISRLVSNTLLMSKGKP